MYLDPTTVRLSDTFLLSDFMGCDSAYRYGYANNFDAAWEDKLAEGRHLAETIDLLQEDFGPCSVAYGFISPDLSRRIVTYQSPDKPSYHRWDLGAAADLNFHRAYSEAAQYTPITLAFAIDSAFPYSRMITYAESEWICFGTRREENEVNARMALYENRYVGTRKPQYVTYSQNPQTRLRQKETHVLGHDWRGRGWPQYHGGGRRQFEHHPVSRFTTIGSFLYDKYAVRDGEKNLPPLTDRQAMAKWSRCAEMAGSVIDAIASEYNNRVSITRAYRSTDAARDWSRRFTLEFVPPTYVDTQVMAGVVADLDGVAQVRVSNHTEPRIQVVGEYL